MSDSLKILGVYIIILFILIISSSCNPVKRVLNDNKKFEIVAKEVVKRGYCVNDTIIIDSTKTEVVIDQRYIYDTIVTRYDVDTIFPSGTHLVIKDGVVSVKCPEAKTIIKTVTKTKYVRDLRIEEILTKENKDKSDSILNLKLIIKEKNLVIQQKELKIVKEKSKFVILIVVLAILTAIYLFFKFKIFKF